MGMWVQGCLAAQPVGAMPGRLGLGLARAGNVFLTVRFKLSMLASCSLACRLVRSFRRSLLGARRFCQLLALLVRGACLRRHFPGELEKVLVWFRDYKIPDGKPANKFGYDNKCMDRAFTEKVGVKSLAPDPWHCLNREGRLGVG